MQEKKRDIIQAMNSLEGSYTWDKKGHFLYIS
jgi:hypothetical protein